MAQKGRKGKKQAAVPVPVPVPAKTQEQLMDAADKLAAEERRKIMSGLDAANPAGRTRSSDSDFDPLAPDPETGAPAALTAEQQGARAASESLRHRGFQVGDDPAAGFYDEEKPTGAKRLPDGYGHGIAAQKPRQRIVMGLVDGDMRMTAVDVLPSSYGIVVLLPNDENGTLFTPKPGTEIRLEWADKSVPCFFPGVTFELPMLHCLGLVFIRAEPV